MNDLIVIALAQMKITPGDVDKNLERALSMLLKASNDGADITVLPEMFSSGFYYEDLPGVAMKTPSLLQTLKEFSRERGILTIFSAPEREGGRIYNTAYTIGKDGRIKGKYRKIHLFGLTGEDRFFSGGDNLTLVRAGPLKIAPIICYDLRFPELSRKATLKGAEMLIYCSQWPKERISHWKALLKARAIENQLFVAGANGCGKSGKILLGGNSVILSPYGEVLGQLGTGEGILTVRIKREDVKKFRRLIPCLKDRVPEAY